MRKGSIHQENITVINIYVPNIRASKYIRQILTDVKGVTDNSKIIVKLFNTPLSTINRSSRQSTRKHWT